MPLNQQQKAFAHSYVNNKNNASQAYRDAGYKCGTPESTWAAASRLLGKVSVQQYIAELKAEIAKQTLIDAEKVVEELVYVGCSDITNIVSFTDNNVIYKNSAELPKSVTAAIASIERHETKKTDKEGNEFVNTTMKLKMHPKATSLKMLGDYAGLGDEIAIARRIFRKYGWNVFFDDHQMLQVEKIDVAPSTQI
ncbi:MAG: terminase small subunit [Chroococcidiopsis sp.]